MKKGIAYQIRAMRDGRGWSQQELAAKINTSQNAISRLESAEYGRFSLQTLQKLAAAFDVGLVVRFVPFSEMVDWVSGTPHINRGLNTKALAVPQFEKDLLSITEEPDTPRGGALVSELIIGPQLIAGRSCLKDDFKTTLVPKTPEATFNTHLRLLVGVVEQTVIGSKFAKKPGDYELTGGAPRFEKEFAPPISYKITNTSLLRV